MFFKNFTFVVFILFIIIEELNTYLRKKGRFRYINEVYLFSGITVCNGTRQPDVRIELGSINAWYSFSYSILSKAYTDQYGVFMLNVGVEREMESKFELNFYHCCGHEDCKRDSYKANCSLDVSSLNCTKYQNFREFFECRLSEVKLLDGKNCELLNPIKKEHEHYAIRKWNLEISYFIFENFTNINEAKKNIQTVVNEVQNNTCIEFAHKNQEIIGQNGINFLKSNICESEFIGMKFKNEPQFIYLTDECSYSMRTIRSLLFEALGLLPQVFRKDRNHYVTLKFLYMDQSKVPRFYYNYQPINNSLRFYDFSSITHFNSTMYSVNETLKVITPIVNYTNFYENMMGRIEEPSFFDYKALNNYYCKNECPKENYCSNHGYHISNRCDKCICSLSYRNDRCEVINYGNLTICGYTSVYAISHLQHIVRSNIDYCLYHLVTHDIRGHVFIRFPYFRGMFLSKICSFNNSIEIKYQERLSNPGICLCYSDDIEAPEIISESYHMIVVFNFQVYRSYVFFEYMKVNSIDFKYRHLDKYERISHLISNECNQLHYNDLSEKCIKAYHGIF